MEALAPTQRLTEQVECAHELYPDALDVRPVWKAQSATLDVGAMVWVRDEFTGERRGQCRSFRRVDGRAEEITR